MNEEFPTWLKAMQNGSIGEARTKAFLLDRFWVLDRSVDIDGADFIIQRRLTSQNLLDKSPPRFGVVQVKFFGSEKTTHYIHQEYILDQEGLPRSEFFAICHTGTERAPKKFIYSASEINSKFKVMPAGHSQAGKYELAGTSVLRDNSFEVKDNYVSLNRIEHALAVADFRKNRFFMSWVLPNALPDKDAIEPVYREFTSYFAESIAEEFLHLKQTARKGLDNIEEVHYILRGIVEAIDPEEAFNYTAELEMLCKGYDRWYVDLPRDIQNKDWEQFVLEHKQKVAVLKKLGIHDGFSALAFELKSQFISNIYDSVFTGRERNILLEITYNKDDLSGGKINHTAVPTSSLDVEEHFRLGKIETSTGKLLYHFRPYGYIDKLLDGGKSELPEVFFKAHQTELHSVLAALLRPFRIDEQLEELRAESKQQYLDLGKRI